MKKKNATGKLIAIDMYNCGINEILDETAAEAILSSGCRDFKMQCQEIIKFKEDEQHEYSLSAICRKGHVTLHVYPELGFIAADIFTCSEQADSAGLARYIRTKFNADKSKITLVDRVDFGSESDMKPNRRSTTKFIRRTQNIGGNIGGQLKKMILKPKSI